MRIISCTIAACFLISFMFFSGCGSRSQQTSIANQPATPSTIVQQTEASDETVAPEPKPEPIFPILVGKSKEAAQKILGTPDHVRKNDSTQGLTAYSNELVWEYSADSFQGYGIIVHYEVRKQMPGEPSPRPVITDKVQEVGIGTFSSPGPLTPQTSISKTLLDTKPTAIYFAQNPGYSNSKYQRLILSWHLKSQVF